VIHQQEKTTLTEPKILACAMSLTMFAACAAAPAPQLSDQSGAQLFETLCASCHGVTGKGDGPVAASLSVKAADLTHISLRSGGRFPAEDVRRTIDGRFTTRAHGSREMPVWGQQLYYSADSDESTARTHSELLIARLVKHIEGMQAKQ
jgi:mono/diheme cytochrome c family protein